MKAIFPSTPAPRPLNGSWNLVCQAIFLPEIVQRIIMFIAPVHHKEIIAAGNTAFLELAARARAIGPEEFILPTVVGKWSPAQQVHHLILSTRNTTAAFALPKFLVRWVGGRPSRASSSYTALKTRYLELLQQGGRSSTRYLPAAFDQPAAKEKLLKNWEETTKVYQRALSTNWTDPQLDAYQVKHPLLGKITLRELGYFTIFHCIHHSNSLICL